MMLSPFRIFLTVFLSIFLGSFAMASSPVAKPTQAHQVITSSGGEWLNVARPLKAEELAGRIILLDFWTFCCINCQHIIPELKILEKEFGEKLTVIGVHSGKFGNEGDTSQIEAAIGRHGIEHAVVNDRDYKIWKQFGVRAWPTLALIGQDGMLKQIYSGEGHTDDIRADVKKLLAKGNVRTDALPMQLKKASTPSVATPLSFPGKFEIAALPSGETRMFIADSAHHQIVMLDMDGHELTRFGSGVEGFADGAAAAAQFKRPQGVLLHGNVLYVADTENHRLRAIDLVKNTVSTLAGTGERGSHRLFGWGSAAGKALASPWDLALSNDGSEIIIANAGSHQLWGYHLADKKLRIVAGSGAESIDDGGLPGNSLSQPSGLSRVGDTLYFVDSETSSLRQLKDEKITTLIGEGLFEFGLKDGTRAQGARMQHTLGLFATPEKIYLADSYNHAIRVYDIASKTLSTLTGNGKAGFKDGALKEAQFAEPSDVHLYQGKLYVADTNNSAIRIIDLEKGTVSTLKITMKPRADIACDDGLCYPNAS